MYLRSDPVWRRSSKGRVVRPFVIHMSNNGAQNGWREGMCRIWESVRQVVMWKMKETNFCSCPKQWTRQRLEPSEALCL